MKRTDASGAGAKRSLAYVPALDGLRAICVIGVLCFHARFEWARGGFLGVSTFFTLSGFLVTSLLFAEIDGQLGAGAQRARVSLAGFWRRRLRRLVPASVVTLVLVVLAAPWLVGPEAQGRLGADAITSLLYVVNWRFVQGEYAYALLFSDPSLLQHYWSLAIEGQLYVVLPLAAAFATRARNPQRSFGVTIGVLLAAGVGLSFVLGADPETHDRIYYGTDTRAPELLAGALLALAVRSHPKETGRSRGPAIDALGWIAAVGLLAAFARVDLASAWLHRGGFALYALLSSVIVVACLRGGSLSRTLAWGPLVWIGEISYGVYLFHWPIYRALDVWLDGPSPGFTLAVGGAATVALAAASHALIEAPIRRGRSIAGQWPLRSTSAALVGVTALTLIWLPGPAVLDELRGRPEAEGSMADLDVAGGEARIAVFGDSVGFSLNMALADWLRTRPEARTVPGQVALGCGLLMPDFVREVEAQGRIPAPWMRPRVDGLMTRQACLDLLGQMDERIERSDPDLAFVVGSLWDLVGAPGAASGEPVRVGQPETDARLRRTMGEFVDRLTRRGGDVAWTTLPPFVRNERYPMQQAEAEAARLHYNELVYELAARHPGRVHVVDLAAHVEAWPGGVFDEALREDGIHFTRQGGRELLENGLGDELIALARAVQRRGKTRAAAAAPGHEASLR